MVEKGLSLDEIIAKKESLIELKKVEYVKRASVFSLPAHTGDGQKAVAGETDVYKIVGNTAWLMDSDNDVLTDGSWAKSIFERASKIKFLHDHIHEVSAIVGDIVGAKTESFSVTGYTDDEGNELFGNATGLVFDVVPKAMYNPKVYELYKNGNINQHSIGFRYIDVRLATAKQEDAQGRRLWDEFLPKLLNPLKAEKKGYFWLVKELKVMEVSAVLWGANSITPVLSAPPSAAGEKSDVLTQAKEPDAGATKSLFHHFSNIKLNL